MLIGAELFFHLLHPGRYMNSGRVPTLQETEFGMILRRHIQHPGLPFGRISDIMFNIGKKRQFWCTGTLFLDDWRTSLFSGPKHYSSWNVRLISQQPLHEMAVGDLSCSYHGNRIMRDLTDHMIKHCMDFSSWKSSFRTNQTCSRITQISWRNLKSLGICSWYLGIMEMTARKHFTCLITQCSNVVAVQCNSE